MTSVLSWLIGILLALVSFLLAGVIILALVLVAKTLIELIRGEE